MIQCILQKSDGAWEVPNHTLLPPLEETVNACAKKCDATIERLKLLSSGRVGAEDFKRDLTHLTGKVTILTQRVKQFRQIAIEEIDRKAVTALFVQLAVDIGKLKALHANPHLFDEADRVYVDDFLKGIAKTVGEVPQEFYANKTSKLSCEVRALPEFSSLWDSLKQFKEKLIAIPTHPSLAISFSDDDQEITTLIADLLKRAMNNVHIIDDCGPYSGREKLDRKIAKIS